MLFIVYSYFENAVVKSVAERATVKNLVEAYK
jgi:hypothetical protein